jgi:hypothetical protein
VHVFLYRINEARAIELLGVLAGSLGLFRTRGHAYERLKQFDAYLIFVCI